MSNDKLLKEHGQDHADGVDRRGFLKCMAWAGTGVIWTLSAGILSSCNLSQASNAGVLQKVEGKVTFHTAASTAYPQPAPGDAPAPGPLRVIPEQLLSSLGIRQVNFVQKAGAPVVVDAQIT